MPTIPATAFELLAQRFAHRHQLDRADLTALSELPHAVKIYEQNQYLLREGDKPLGCALMISGFTYRHKIVGDGGRQIVAIHMAGDLIDGQNLLLDVADHNIQALTETAVIRIGRDDLLDLAFDRPRIGRALWFESLVEAAIFREWVVNVGRRPARARVAHMLCEVALRCEAAGLCSRDAFELPMTQEQLGDVLGLTAVHVNRTLKALAADGFITRSKRSVVVSDWDKLRRVADFTSGYLHLEEHPDGHARDWRSPSVDALTDGDARIA
jgi:CRP-like cAMP-binding protein